VGSFTWRSRWSISTPPSRGHRIRWAVLVGPVPDVAFEERRIAFVLLGGQVTELVET